MPMLAPSLERTNSTSASCVQMDGRLRVGYISKDFGFSSVGQLLPRFDPAIYTPDPNMKTTISVQREKGRFLASSFAMFAALGQTATVDVVCLTICVVVCIYSSETFDFARYQAV
eukprot:907889-Rhodomonas_salina.1